MKKIVVTLDSPPKNLLGGVIGVYLLKHRACKRVYVGSSSNVHKRLINHAIRLRKQCHENPSLQEAYLDSPHFDVVVYPVSDRESAYKLEQDMLDKFDQHRDMLFNRSMDAKRPGLGIVHSDEAKNRIRQARLGTTAPTEVREKQRASALSRWENNESEKVLLRDHLNKQRLDPEFESKRRKAVAESNNVAVMVGDELFESINTVISSFGVSRGTVRNRCLSQTKRFLDWRYV
jgi:group I intron endonuclease